MSEVSEKQAQETKEMTINAKELIYTLVELLENKEYSKKLPYPKFNIQEARFIRDLIFHKQKGLLFSYLADYFMNNSTLTNTPFNGPWVRKLRFFYYLLETFNATKAAKMAGYSQKTARQQGCRLVKEIRGYRRIS